MIACRDRVAVSDLQSTVRHRAAGDHGDVVGKDTERARRRQQEWFSTAFGRAGDLNGDRGLPRQVRIDQFGPDHVRRAISPPIEEQHADAWQGQVTGNNQRKILVHSRCVPARVLDHIAGEYTHEIFTRLRDAQVHPFDVVDIVAGRRVGDRFATSELVSPINSAVRRDDFKVQVVDQGRDRAGESRHIRVGQRDFERLVRTRDHGALLVYLAVGEQVGLVNELDAAGRADDLRQVDAPPALVLIRRRIWAKAIAADIDRGIDQRSLDQRGRRRRVAVGFAIILHEHRRRTGRVRTRLAGAALILVVIVDGQPGVFVGRGSGLQRGDPGTWRHHVRLDPPVFTRAAARKIRQRVLAVGVNKKIRTIVLGRAGGNHVLAHGGTVDGLRAGPGVARGEFQNVRLVTRASGIGVADQLVEFRRAQVVAALNVVTPTVRSDHCADSDGVPGQGLVAGRRFKIARAIKNPLDHKVSARGHSEAVEGAALIRLARGRVAGNDTRHVRAVAVFVPRIGQRAVLQEGVHAPSQVKMHRCRVAIVQASVRHRHLDIAAVESELLGHRARAIRAIGTPHDLRGNLVEQLRPRRWLDPQDRVGAGQRCQLPRRHLSLENVAEAEFRFVRNRPKGSTHHGPVLCRRNRRKQHPHARNARLLQPRIKLVLRPIRADPTHEGHALDLTRAGPIKPRDKCILRDITDQFNAHFAQLLAPDGLNAVDELNQEQPRGRRFDGQRLKRGGAFRRGGDGFVAQPDDPVLRQGAERADEKATEDSANELAPAGVGQIHAHKLFKNRDSTRHNGILPQG